MGLSIDWFGLAEGVASDARGSLTLVGFSPDFLVMPDLPAPLNLFLVLLVREDEDPESAFVDKADIALDAQVYGPDEKVLGGIQQTANLAAKRYADLPGAVILTVGLRLTFQQHGKHTATMEFSMGALRLKAERVFHIMAK